ncbi:hypothetical protein KUCAC02_030849, partial [Chaenocephalus aceratus]
MIVCQRFTGFWDGQGLFELPGDPRTPRERKRNLQFVHDYTQNVKPSKNCIT